MSDIKLTYDETPLAWPANVLTTDLNTCSTCGIRILAPQPGSLQCLTRRPSSGTGGDGVTIEEFIGIGADYRGQRYTFEEAVFHTPGLHRFPDQQAPYPAEYHIHMRTMSAPIRYITVVLPLSHTVPTGVGPNPSTKYFASISAIPDPAIQRPTLESLFQGSSDVIQYQGPDIRGRTAEQNIPPSGQKSEERQFLLVLSVGHIRASDLERIPREGSASTDPRDLPAPGVQPKKAVLRDRLLRSSILARPGILHEAKAKAAQVKTEVECKPIKVVNGRDVIEKFDGKIVDVKKLLGLDEQEKESGQQVSQQARVIRTTSFAISMILGIILADIFAEKFWSLFFIDSDRLHKMSWMKIVFYIIILSSLIAIF